MTLLSLSIRLNGFTIFNGGNILSGTFTHAYTHIYMLVGRAQKAFAYLVYILINSVAASTDYGRLVCPLNVTELSNANSHSVSLLNEFRGVCIYRRGTRRSFIEWRVVSSKTHVIFCLTIVSMKTNDLYLLFDRWWKNWRVKSLGITRASQIVVIGYTPVFDELILYFALGVEMPEATLLPKR